MIDGRLLDVLMVTPGIAYGAGANAVFWGPPSGGKSALLSALVRERYKVPFVMLSPGQRGEGGFGVVPFITGDGASARIKFPVQAWVDVFEETDGRGVVFVDEISTATPAVQSALLQLLLDRILGDHRFPIGVRVIAAGNTPESAANGFDLAPPLVSRLMHFQWEPPSPAEHDKYITSKPFKYRSDENAIGTYDPTPFDGLEAKVKSEWSSTRPTVAATVVGFLRANPSKRQRDFVVGKDVCYKAHPSRRGWDVAVDAMTVAHSLGYTDLDDTLVEAAVGADVSVEFSAYRRTLDLPDPEAVLDGKVPFVHDPRRLDRTAVVLRALGTFVREDKSARRTNRADVLWQVLEDVGQTAGDLCLFAAKQLVMSGLDKSVAATRAQNTLRHVVKALT